MKHQRSRNLITFKIFYRPLTIVGHIEGNGSRINTKNDVLDTFRAEPPRCHKHIVDIANDGEPQVSFALGAELFGKGEPSKFIKNIFIDT